MTRYTINIGDEFPLNDERPGAAGRRWGFGLRALFAVAVAAIIFSHPFHAAVLLGLALLIRRNGWFAETRARWRRGAAMRREAWRSHGCDSRWNDRRPEARQDRPDRDDKRGDEKPDRYKAFV